MCWVSSWVSWPVGLRGLSYAVLLRVLSALRACTLRQHTAQVVPRSSLTGPFSFPPLLSLTLATSSHHDGILYPVAVAPLALGLLVVASGFLASLLAA